jgi:hypothetical protein
MSRGHCYGKGKIERNLEKSHKKVPLAEMQGPLERISLYCLDTEEAAIRLSRNVCKY